jgi:hypothetical protein
MIPIIRSSYLRKSVPGSEIVSLAKRVDMRLLLFAGLMTCWAIMGQVAGSSSVISLSRGAEPDETPPAKAMDEQNLAQDPAPSTGRLYVLLIGCGHYPNLSRDYQLQGPPNDVAITRELLQSERFGVKPEDVMILVSGSVPEREPTGANIRAAFEKMCATVQRNDQVLILLAGHGCQVPNNNPEDDPEPDGLDEAFVPADVSAWDAKNPPRPNELILDDEIGAWTDRLSQAGARVFLVADCCHSGSINRGPGEPLNWVRERRLPPIFSSAPDERRESSPDPSNDELTWEVPAGVVSLFAVPARFAELEDRMPPHSNGGVATVHGRLTFALNQVLRNARRSLTYRELIQQIVWQYQAWSWNPRPYINGADLDREVLGVREWPTRSWITATKELKRFRLNVGFLDQIAPGSIFELFPADRGEGSDVRLGFLKVSRVEAGECLAEPCAYENHAAVHIDKLPMGANAELVYRELGDARLPVGLMAATNETPNQELWTACEAALVNFFKDPRRLVRPPGPEETPQLFVVVGATQAWIQHGTGSVEGFPDSGSVAYSPLANDDKLEATLAGSLTMIARATNLVRLALPLPTKSVLPAENRRSLASSVLDVEILQAVPKGSNNFVLVDDPTSMILDDGDWIRIQVRNVSKSNWDLTGLVVESGYAINPIPLRRNELTISQRLPPNSDPAYFRVKINNSTFGLDNFVLIVVEAGPDPEPASFSYLKQKGPEAASLVAKPVTRSSERFSRFRQLVESSTLDGAISRGPGQMDEPGIVWRIPWRVLPPDSTSNTPK